MKQFSLEEYFKNPNRKIITRNGRSARIICTDRVCKTHTILALLFEDEDRDREEVYQYTSKGEYYPNASSPHDLFFVPVKKEGWINVYGSPDGRNWLGANLYNTEKAAKANTSKSRVATIKIEWEE